MIYSLQLISLLGEKKGLVYGISLFIARTEIEDIIVEILINQNMIGNILTIDMV